MSSTYRIDQKHGVIITTFEGAMTDEDVLAYQRKLSKDARFRPEFHQLADVRRLDADKITSSGIRAVAERDPSGLDSKLAIVVSNDELFGLARMFQILRDEDRKEIAVFRDMDQALAWLGIAPHAYLKESGFLNQSITAYLDPDAA